MVLLAIFVSLFFIFSLVSARLERTIFTAPIAFTTLGILMAPLLPSLEQVGLNATIFLALAELGLVLLLFTDASQTNLAMISRIGRLPVRLLSVGMLLTIGLGMLAALAVFPRLSIWEAGILAVVLAPTDASLGEIIIKSPRVPVLVRESLLVEAGLNDGLAVPFLLFFMTIAAARTEGGPLALTQFIVEQLGGGALVGLVIGLGGGWLLRLASCRGWVEKSFQQIGVVALPLLCLAICAILDTSMFIAAFVAGLAVQLGLKDAAEQSVEFGGQWGKLANLSVFFLFGAIVMRNLGQFRLAFWLYAALSLTVVRMVPVAISLIRSGFSPATDIFIGWFGPRGLASIVLGLVYLKQELSLPGEPTIRIAVIVTVLLSIYAHGISASGGSELYARSISSLDSAAPELQALAAGSKAVDPYAPGIA